MRKRQRSVLFDVAALFAAAGLGWSIPRLIFTRPSRRGSAGVHRIRQTPHDARRLARRKITAAHLKAFIKASQAA